MCVNKNAELLPYYQKAKELLNYNPNTGVFTKFVKRSGCYKEIGRINSLGYRQISININKNNKRLFAHRLAWFIYYRELPDVIDHSDGNKLNNAIKNLRSCTQQENTLNRGKSTNNTSGFKGVIWHKVAEKWIAQIKFSGKNMHLGCFNCRKEASDAYENKAKELFGEFYNS